MVLNYKMKFLKGFGELEEIEGMGGIVLGNLDNGNLELYRVVKNEKNDVPFFASPWQKIDDFDVVEKGTIGKKKIMTVKFKDQKIMELEINEKDEVKALLSDCIGFMKSAEEKFPKGATEKAVESLAKVSEALGEAFGKGLNKAKGLGKDLRTKVGK